MGSTPARGKKTCKSVPEMSKDSQGVLKIIAAKDLRV